MEYALYYGASQTPLAFAVLNLQWPPLYQLKKPNGSLSGAMNLARIKETGIIWAGRLPEVNKHTSELYWKPAQVGDRAPLAR